MALFRVQGAARVGIFTSMCFFEWTLQLIEVKGPSRLGSMGPWLTLFLRLKHNALAPPKAKHNMTWVKVRRLKLQDVASEFTTGKLVSGQWRFVCKNSGGFAECPFYRGNKLCFVWVNLRF